MTPFWEKFFYILTFLVQGPSFLNPRTYSIMHQIHHQKSDKKEDPHSPLHSKNVWTLMIKTYKIYMEILTKKFPLENYSIQHRYPSIPSLDRLAEHRASLLIWLVIYPAIYLYMAPPIWAYLFLPLHFVMGPIQGAMVNYLGHKVGYRNYKLPDNSRNACPTDLFLMGELYQNNHHRSAQKLNFAHRWFEVDLTYYLCRVLAIIGIIKIEESAQ
jgi:stearoyl-CoA desaturase (Delta-9 desaturase)